MPEFAISFYFFSIRQRQLIRQTCEIVTTALSFSTVLRGLFFRYLLPLVPRTMHAIRHIQLHLHLGEDRLFAIGRFIRDSTGDGVI